MKKLMVGINSKFIHSNLAIRYIQRYGASVGVKMEIAEYTINQSCDYILDELIMHQPDVVAFSCYLWNIEYIRRLSNMLKKVLPELLIVYGGPEVSYDSERWIEKVDELDYVISGEGERATVKLFECLEVLEENRDQLSQDEIQEQLSSLESVTYRWDGVAIKNRQGLPMDMSQVPFVYDAQMEGLEHRIIYYETSRGCPYSCEYCLSSIEAGVRFRPLEMVYEELQFFLDQRVMQVKFVDRTFNAKRSHAMGIWQYLKEHDNGYTNFHFEMTADILDDAMIELIKSLRVGLVQFEIGVQSTNEATIVDIQRKVDFEGVKDKVIKIKNGHNVHLHLDLIAGLPREDYQAFSRSFNDVMALRPEQLQLGFLKVLKGSMMHMKREGYGIVHRESAPYEVLYTPDMDYYDLRKLKHIEELLELYYNSEQFIQSVEYMMLAFESPFAFYEAYASYWEEKGYYHLKHTRVTLYHLIYEFGETMAQVDTGFLGALLIHDLSSKEKPKKWPEYVVRADGTPDAIKQFYKDASNRDQYFKHYEANNVRQIQRMTHIESYEYDIILWMQIREIKKLEAPQFLYYDYKDRDLMNGVSKISKVTI